MREEFVMIETMLNKINIPLTSKTNNRRGFKSHRNATFGLVKERYSGKINNSRFTRLYPHIYEELLRLGDLYCPFIFTSIHINKNVVCPPHKDAKNVGKSMIVSVGEYEGCNLVIEGKKYDTKYNPLVFDGAKYEHYNTDDLIGTKYSLIYYNII